MSSKRPSNRSVGRNYHSALVDLRRLAEEGGRLEFNGKRLSKKWLVEELGCSPGLLSSNHLIRGTIRDWERQLSKSQPVSAVIARREPAIDLPVATGPNSPLHDKFAWGELSVEGKSVLLPTVFDGNKISVHESDWCRHLVLNRDYSRGSVEGSLVILRTFRQFLRSKKLKFTKWWTEHLSVGNLTCARRVLDRSGSTPASLPCTITFSGWKRRGS
ncbi:hypothetical protein LZK75_16865 [Rhizobium leguminosarum]|nr:hypothetical protein LZK75_16865 [Rhizobium leguminosarum]